MTYINAHIEDGVGTITMTHSEKKNTLSHGLIEAIIGALRTFQDKGVRCVVLRAEPGAKVWSAGHDVMELPEGKRDPLGWSDPLRRLVREIKHFPHPIIALIEGGVWGGACEVVIDCDMVIAAPSATFAVTPAKLGVPYNVQGVLNFLNTIPAPLLKEMVFTARPIDVHRAERHGIVNHIVPDEKIEGFTQDICRAILSNAPLSISVVKESIRILRDASPITPAAFEKIQGLRRIVYDSNDYQEGLAAFREKRKPEFTGT